MQAAASVSVKACSFYSCWLHFAVPNFPYMQKQFKLCELEGLKRRVTTPLQLWLGMECTPHSSPNQITVVLGLIHSEHLIPYSSKRQPRANEAASKPLASVFCLVPPPVYTFSWSRAGLLCSWTHLGAWTCLPTERATQN